MKPDYYLKLSKAEKLIFDAGYSEGYAKAIEMTKKKSEVTNETWKQFESNLMRDRVISEN